MAGSKLPKYPGLTKTLRHIQFEDIPQPLFQCPRGAESVTIACGCGAAYRPPWNQRLKFEFNTFQSADGASWALAGLDFPCPTCGTMNHLPFPECKETRSRTTLFGDEAYEWIGLDSGLVYTIAFAAFQRDFGSAIETKLASLKQRIRPSADSSSWPLHISDLRNERCREKHNVTLTIQEMNDLIRSLARSLAEPADERLLAATVFPGFKIKKGKVAKRRIEDIVRDRVLSAAILTLTDHLTKQDFPVDFVLEAQTDAHTQNRIDYSVERVGRGLRHDLGFLYVSRCQGIGLPITEPKRAHAEMEVADLVAYMVRRYFLRTNSGKPTEFPLEDLGEVFWGSFAPKRFGTISAKGYPWDFFFPGFQHPIPFGSAEGSAPSQ